MLCILIDLMCLAASGLLLDNSHPVPHSVLRGNVMAKHLHTGLCTFALHGGDVGSMISPFQYVLNVY